MKSDCYYSNMVDSKLLLKRCWYLSKQIEYGYTFSNQVQSATYWEVRLHHFVQNNIFHSFRIFYEKEFRFVAKKIIWKGFSYSLEKWFLDVIYFPILVHHHWSIDAFFPLLTWLCVWFGYLCLFFFNYCV